MILREGPDHPRRHSGPPLRNVLHSSTKARCDVSRPPFLLLFLSFSPFWRLVSKQMNGYPNARIMSDHTIIGLSMRPDGGRSTVLFSAGKSGWPGWWPSARYVSTCRRRRRRRETSGTTRGARLKAKVSPNVPERKFLSLMHDAMNGAIDRCG